MPFPIAVKNGQAFAFPNVCLTPAPPSAPVPIPYPSIADLGGADDVSENVTVGGLGVILAGTSTVSSTSGDEAGTDGGVTSMTNGGKAEFPAGSGTMLINGSQVVRMGDSANMNVGAAGANAVGTVLSGDASVLVGARVCQKSSAAAWATRSASTGAAGSAGAKARTTSASRSGSS